MAIRSGTFGRVASRSWFDAEAYTGGWFIDEMIPPDAAPPVTPTGTPRRYPIGNATRLMTGRMR